MILIACRTLLAALLLIPAACWGQVNRAFTYWGTGVHSQEFEVAIDLSAVAEQYPFLTDFVSSLAEQSSDSIHQLGEISFGPRFFVGHQFNNYLAVESGAAIGLSKLELLRGSMNIKGGRTFAVDFKLLLTYPISEATFIRAHLGSRFYNELTYTVRPPGENPYAWTLEETQAAVSDLTQGVGVGFAWGPERAVLLEYERLDRGDRPLESFSVSLLLRL